jgi:2-oxoglutarate ferredoxin oxidoreductase subunit alpha
MGPIQVRHPAPADYQNGHEFLPFERDPDTLGRPWAIPGTSGLEHRVGGLAKQPRTGNVSYVPEDHQQMVDERAAKVAKLVEVIPPLNVFGAQEGELLVVGWGSSYGAIHQAVDKAHRVGKQVGAIHLRHLNPFPGNLGEILERFDQILVPEMNTGQLALLLRARYLRQVVSFSKVQGRPFKITEITGKIDELLA